MKAWKCCTILLACVTLWALADGRGVAARALGASSSSDWQLDFAFHDPQRIAVMLPGHKETTTYWYLLFTVTNRTGRDVQYYPSFEFVTDSLHVVEGGAKIHPAVYDAISARHKKAYPFFAPPSKVTGLLLQGEQNARTSAAVFRMFDDRANAFVLYVSGLSSRVERRSNPGFDASKPESRDNPRSFLLRRTLAVRYDLPGDTQSRAQSRPIRRSRSWVMR